MTEIFTQTYDVDKLIFPGISWKSPFKKLASVSYYNISKNFDKFSKSGDDN